MCARLVEFRRKEFFSNLDKRTINKSKNVHNPKYIGITVNYVIYIEVPSVTANPPTNYIVKIKLLDMKDAIKDKSLSFEDKVRLSIDGDIKISCSCPAFKYWGYSYIVSQLDSKVGRKQDIFPKVRNPNLEGTLCKHSYIATRYVGRVWKKIAKDIKDKNFLRRGDI